MPSTFDPEGPDRESQQLHSAGRENFELELFESLVHHLIEKGLLTRNDALSIVQTVAEVSRGRSEEPRSEPSRSPKAILERLYSSFDALAEQADSKDLAGENIVRLRPPLHDDRPKFPRDN